MLKFLKTANEINIWTVFINIMIKLNLFQKCKVDLILEKLINIIYNITNFKVKIQDYMIQL